MKPIKFSKKLRFTKETVADLNSKEMNEAHAGVIIVEVETYGTVYQTQCPSGGVPCNYC
jgi:hypothetical protein